MAKIAMNATASTVTSAESIETSSPASPMLNGPTIMMAQLNAIASRRSSVGPT